MHFHQHHFTISQLNSTLVGLLASCLLLLPSVVFCKVSTIESKDENRMFPSSKELEIRDALSHLLLLDTYLKELVETERLEKGSLPAPPTPSFLAGDAHIKRASALPYSGGIYGKRANLPYSGGLYGKRANIPFSGGLYGKRAAGKVLPYSGGMYGKRSPSSKLPFSGGLYGRKRSDGIVGDLSAEDPFYQDRSSISIRSMPINGGLYG